ncbi:MAG: alpha/beta hydrolase family protein [Planctomycetota bacterium]|jgi:dipeptidyl aminopeptidase/acylaminoacyl peptidase
MKTCLPLLPLLGAILASNLSGQEANERSAFTVDDLLNVRSARSQSLSPDGRWLAYSLGSQRDRIGIDNYRYGDPSYQRPSLAEYLVVDTSSGESTPLYHHRENLRGMSWSPDSSRLAYLIMGADGLEGRIWHRTSGECESFLPPEGSIFAHDSSPTWLPDGSALLLALRNEGWTEQVQDQFKALTKGPVVVFSSEKPFLAWEELRRMSLQKSLHVMDLETGDYRQILPEMNLRSFQLSEDAELLRYEEDQTKKTSYEVIFGSDARLMVMPLAGGEAREIVPSTRKRRTTWARDGRHYAFADKGDVFFASVDMDEARRLTGEEEEDAEEKEEDEAEGEDKDEEERERFSIAGLSPAGKWLLASSKKGQYLIDTSSGERQLVLAIDEKDKKAPRQRLAAWSPDGSGFYLSYASRREWERGFLYYDIDQGELTELIKDGHSYGSFQVAKSGKRIVFSRNAGNRPADLYASDPNLSEVLQLCAANPFLENRRLGKTELIRYLDLDGEELNGVLYYPAEYEAGKTYPTIALVYEEFFDDRFRGNINHLTANGYAVIQPSVRLETGYPGEAWLKGVTAAVNRLIEMGIADPDRLGVQGTSYGGYATNLLITQTKRFKAAINVSGKVNMVSFYTDSPRLGVRNIHAPENSQDRIGATLWEQPQKYVAHSAIMDADRIDTPLLLITGEQDHNVPDRQAMEMYYALRRLGKTVDWVRYVNGGHGTPTSTVAEVHDYYGRILAWYDKHLAVEEEEVETGPVVGNGH